MQSITTLFLGGIATAGLGIGAIAELRPAHGTGGSPGDLGRTAREALDHQLDRCRDEAGQRLVDTVRHARLAPTAAVGSRQPLAPPTKADEFKGDLNAHSAYTQTWFDVCEGQALDLLHAMAPHYITSDAARAEVFETIGASWSLCETWMFSLADGQGAFTAVETTDGGFADFDDLLLLPVDLAPIDFGNEPDFVAGAMGPYNEPNLDGYVYEMRVNGTDRSAGVAAVYDSPQGTMLTLWPDTTSNTLRILTTTDVTMLRHYDVTSGPLDYPAVWNAIAPSFSPPAWTFQSGSDGLPAQSGPCDGVLECVYGACQAYDTAMDQAAAAWRAHVDSAMEDAWSDFDDIVRSQMGMNQIFSQLGPNGTVGGASQAAWDEYFMNFHKDNWAELNQDLENAKNNYENARCNAARNLRDAVIDCIGECPDWQHVIPFIQSWCAAQGC